MAIGRQVRLTVGGVVLDLNDATYVLLADGGWTSSGEALEVKVRVNPATMLELDRQVGAIQKCLGLADAYEQFLVGQPVEVWTKTCDDLTYTAELGATWRKKRVKGGSVLVSPLTGMAAAPAAVVTLSLEVEREWRRVAPESVLEGATVGASAFGAGAIQTTAGNPITGRRINDWSLFGVAVRLFWVYYDSTTDFFAVPGTTLKAYYNAADNKFYMQDDTPGTPFSISTAAVAWTAGTTHELVFIWDPIWGEMHIVLDGVLAATPGGACTVTNADTYALVDPAAGQSAYLLSAQIWAARLTTTEAIALRTWGQPEPELTACVPPAADTNTAALYKLANMPGEAPGALRVILDGAAQDYQRVLLGLRPLRNLTTAAWECESGTLGAATASVADANASGGNVARFTPADTAWGTRTTLVLAADPDDVWKLRGEHRVWLACKDAAGATGLNQVRFRLVVAGQAEAWSEANGVAAVATYSLVNLGTVRIPPGEWPAEALAATTDVHGGSYVTLEVQVANTAGSGGGTFDLDALYLLPAEVEGTLDLALDVSAYYGLLDFTGERPNFIGAADPRSLEFAAWGNYTGDRLELPPSGLEGGTLMLRWLRDTDGQAYMTDVCDVWLYVEPRWR